MPRSRTHKEIYYLTELYEFLALSPHLLFSSPPWPLGLLYPRSSVGTQLYCVLDVNFQKSLKLCWVVQFVCKVTWFFHFIKHLMGFYCPMIFLGKIGYHGLPVGEPWGAELVPLAGELAGAMLVPVINQVIAQAQVLAVWEDDALVEQVAKVSCDPCPLVGPCRRVLPWCGREDKHLIVLSQCVDGLDGSWQGLHQWK